MNSASDLLSSQFPDKFLELGRRGRRKRRRVATGRVRLGRGTVVRRPSRRVRDNVGQRVVRGRTGTSRLSC